MSRDYCSGKSFFNNGIICVRAEEAPDGYISGRLPFSRKSHSLETREKISKANKGKPAPFKGRTHSGESKSRMSISAKARAARGIIPDNRGKSNWAKGLSIDFHEGLRRGAALQRGQLRKGNYPSGERHWNWKDNEEHSKPFYEYSKRVHKFTKANYNKHKEIINPLNLPRGRAGVDGAYQLDHIISVHHGFMNGIPEKEIAAVENLQIISWQDNLKKSNK